MRTKSTFTAFLATLALIGVLATPADAGPNPYLMEDEDWVTLTGTVTYTSPHQFRLDYGTGYITVEMDDWDRYDESMWLRNGEKVNVHGRIDDSFFEDRTIEASSVFASERHVFYHASAADEEGDAGPYPLTFVYPEAEDGDWLSLTGTVRDIDDREFTLVTGLMAVTVTTEDMAYHPLDDDGYQQIDEGDRVSVWGEVDDGLFEDRELKAQSITTLSEAPNFGS